MASQLGSAVTPTGHQAYSDLLNTEQQNKAMAQQAFQNQQNQGLAQQQLGQEAMMHQQRMGQSQDQFNAQLVESQRQREHEIGREDIAYQRGLELQDKQQQFQLAQAKSLQDWQNKQIQDAHAYELEFENLKAMREDARDKGQLDAFERISNQMLAVRNKKAKLAMAAALGSRLVGKSQREIESTIDMLSGELGRKVSAEQQNQALASKFAGSLVNRFDESDRKAATDKFNTFQRGQEGFLDAINPFSANFGDVGSAIATGALEGSEWLNLEPANFGRLYGMSGKSTTQASAVAGYVDPATMSETIKGRLIDGTVQQLNEMGLKNFNQDAARKLVGLAMGGGSKAEIAQLSTAAGIPTSTLKYLFDAAARAHEDTASNARFQNLQNMDAKYRQEAGYQPNDLKVLALSKAKEAYGAKSKLLRMAANSFDDTDLTDYNAAIEMLGQMKKRGQYSDLAGSALEQIGMGSEAERLRELMGRLPKAQQQLEEASIGLGDVEEESSGLEALAPLMMARGAQSGNPAFREKLAELLSKYGGQR